MDKDVWRRIVWAVRSVDRRLQRVRRRPRYSDQQILKMYLWTVWHDRPLCWACDRSHYNRWYRPGQVPSISQFSRRLRTPRIQAMLGTINDSLMRSDQPITISFLDGKALAVGGYSHDLDAANGYGQGQFQRGYKLHAWATPDGRIRRFRVLAMNASEPKIALGLIDPVPPGSWVLADAAYDTAPLYAAVEQRGATLLTPLRGAARSPWRVRAMPQSRQAAIRLWEQDPQRCQHLLNRRRTIERIFSALTSYGGGMSPLPNWVRRHHRVNAWVSAKLAIYHARLLLKEAA